VKAIVLGVGGPGEVGRPHRDTPRRPARNLFADALFPQLDTGWHVDAACAGEDLDLFFPDQANAVLFTARAKQICGRCPVAVECLDFAEKSGSSGVWGGTSERERRVPHGNRRLSELDRRLIVRRYGCGERVSTLAVQFEVPARHIYRVVAADQIARLADDGGDDWGEVG
jgi:WhiB family redox-sensing transcriptional regulator